MATTSHTVSASSSAPATSSGVRSDHPANSQAHGSATSVAIDPSRLSRRNRLESARVSGSPSSAASQAVVAPDVKV